MQEVYELAGKSSLSLSLLETVSGGFGEKHKVSLSPCSNFFNTPDSKLLESELPLSIAQGLRPQRHLSSGVVTVYEVKRNSINEVEVRIRFMSFLLKPF